MNNKYTNTTQDCNNVSAIVNTWIEVDVADSNECPTVWSVYTSKDGKDFKVKLDDLETSSIEIDREDIEDSATAWATTQAGKLSQEGSIAIQPNPQGNLAKAITQILIDDANNFNRNGSLIQWYADNGFRVKYCSEFVVGEKSAIVKVAMDVKMSNIPTPYTGNFKNISDDSLEFSFVNESTPLIVIYGDLTILNYQNLKDAGIVVTPTITRTFDKITITDIAVNDPSNIAKDGKYSIVLLSQGYYEIDRKEISISDTTEPIEFSVDPALESETMVISWNTVVNGTVHTIPFYSVEIAPATETKKTVVIKPDKKIKQKKN